MGHYFYARFYCSFFRALGFSRLCPPGSTRANATSDYEHDGIERSRGVGYFFRMDPSRSCRPACPREFVGGSPHCVCTATARFECLGFFQWGLGKRWNE